LPSRSKFIKHTFGGGWATDYGPTAFVNVTPGGQVILPWLNEAENVIYELDGGPHKMPGCTKNYVSALESGARICGVYDAWFSGSAGSPAQHRILNIGTKIKKDNSNNTFTDLFTGMTAGAVPSYCMLEDLLIMSNDSGIDVPKSWDGTTAQNLAGSPPTFSFAVEHLNYVFAAGNKAYPSRLYYCVVLTPNDWAGAGSGYIDISPSDGDGITSLRSFRNQLWIFKGPYKGSIHRLSGSSPTGDDPFARSTFVNGIGAVNHNATAAFGNDLGFMWSDGTYNTLSGIQQYGDYSENSVSRPINTWIRDHVNLTKLSQAQAVNYPEYGVILMTIPIDASTVPNCLLMMDYRFNPPRWAKWKDYNMVTALAQAVDVSATFKRVILAGCTGGFLRTITSATRAIDESASVPFNVITPFMDYDLPGQMKTIEGATVCLNPKSDGDVTIAWSLDGAAASTDVITQGGGGAVLGTFLLGTDILGGGLFKERFSRLGEAGGEFRSIQYQVLENTTGDMELHSISAQITVGAESYENAA
jgi:hypothetical protein